MLDVGTVLYWGALLAINHASVCRFLISDVLCRPECPCSILWWSAFHKPRSPEPPARKQTNQYYYKVTIKAAEISFTKKTWVTCTTTKLKASNYLLNKPEVVANQHHSTLKFIDRLSQSINGFNVKVIGRLIKKEHVGILPGQPGKADTAFLPVRQIPNRAYLRLKKRKKKKRS